MGIPMRERAGEHTPTALGLQAFSSARAAQAEEGGGTAGKQQAELTLRVPSAERVTYACR